MKTLAIIGGGQHGVVVAEIAEATGYTVKGFLDDTIPAGTEISGYKVLGKTELCRNLEQGTEFVIAVGNNATRKAIAENYSDLHWATLIHPSAVVSRRSTIGEGTVICANAVVNTLTKVGRHCIINTLAAVEHGCEIGDYCHIAPGTIVNAYKIVAELSAEKRYV
ncbi:MAG TPA: acetyltransferase [Clostridia bacterium]|jgi:acetyltransferase EpsM|nr:acetyltransferase [Clostridia bacterium]